MRKIYFILFLLFSSSVHADTYPATPIWPTNGNLYRSLADGCVAAQPLMFYSYQIANGYYASATADSIHSCDMFTGSKQFIGSWNFWTFGYLCPGGGRAVAVSSNSAISGASCIIGQWNQGIPIYACPEDGTVGSAANCINAPACLSPQVRNVTTGICGLSPKSNGGSCSVDQVSPVKTGSIDFGNPINAGTGNKWQHETDLAGDAFDLTFDRYYNASTTGNPSNLGAGWSHAYTRSSTVQSLGTWVTILRQDGKEYNFSPSAGLWVTDADVPDRLEELKDSSNVRIGWRYTTADNSIEIYDATGKLTSIADRSGLTQILTYSDASTPATIAPTTGLLIRVTDSFGRQLNFTYDTNSRINILTDPAGGVYHYAYDANNNLASVSYPDGKNKTYLYENTAFPHALTGITDENGNRFATYSYDAQGRATSSEHAGGAERVSLTYNADGSTTVTDALNTARTYNFQTILGVVKSTGQSQPGGSGCGASASTLTYDANGNVASRADFNGNRTNYTYDLTRNLETSRTEGLTSTGATTPATRTITTAWHPTFRLPVQITNGNQQTSYTYNSQGDITQKTVTDTTANTTRSWNTAYTYSTVPGVLVQKVEDGPRTDVSDLTTVDYYPADATCAGGQLGCRGQLMQVTSPLGHITRMTRYSPNGQLEELIDPNGLVTTLAYDVRQRLISVTAGGEITTTTYDPAGLIARVTDPDGAYLAYSYDAAHRLIKTQDNLGNTLTYTLDAMGNRIKEDLLDPNGQLARTQSRVYDALSRLQNRIQAQ